jgi:hypothetical protein
MDGLLRFKPLNQTGNEIPVGVGLLITERHPHRILTVVENGSAAACGAHLHVFVLLFVTGLSKEV